MNNQTTSRGGSGDARKLQLPAAVWAIRRKSEGPRGSLVPSHGVG